MIRLSIELDDVDFDRLIEQYLPVIGDQLRASGNPVGMLLSNGMSAGMAKGILRTLSQDKKEQLAADLINGNAAKLTASIEKMAAEKGFQAKVRALEARQAP